jgi:hypothetical protein
MWLRVLERCRGSFQGVRSSDKKFTPLGPDSPYRYEALESVPVHAVGLREHEHKFQLCKTPMNDGLSYDDTKMS